jgi:hypothetical protein
VVYIPTPVLALYIAVHFAASTCHIHFSCVDDDLTYNKIHAILLYPDSASFFLKKKELFLSDPYFYTPTSSLID